MTIPQELAALITQLDRELDHIEELATEGLNLVRPLLERFPDNVIFIGLLATLNNALFFSNNCKNRIQIIIESFSTANIAIEVIQEAGEDLAELLGRVIEAKMQVSRIVARLKNFP
ncbi:restriction endonuclease subunit S [Lusitaniella coriacea LEGE 07157]|uniref:Restriction endonuclease subunit S n=1 Tax=Lusitaniella coriacea LEGE 07157 TaxID=945747 RepID=A0A8J7E0U4_9CYAN|nr:restriction endonuclease subunit S [Lusitaniella coriacea]MBE9117221.1 restriction endonuclease subunit S [Lusitaniella coriacea LEGE 07157]